LSSRLNTHWNITTIYNTRGWDSVLRCFYWLW